MYLLSGDSGPHHAALHPLWAVAANDIRKFASSGTYQPGRGHKAVPKLWRCRPGFGAVLRALRAAAWLDSGTSASSTTWTGQQPLVQGGCGTRCPSASCPWRLSRATGRSARDRSLARWSTGCCPWCAARSSRAAKRPASCAPCPGLAAGGRAACPWRSSWTTSRCAWCPRCPGRAAERYARRAPYSVWRTDSRIWRARRFGSHPHSAARGTVGGQGRCPQPAHQAAGHDGGESRDRSCGNRSGGQQCCGGPAFPSPRWLQYRRQAHQPSG